MAWTPVTGAEPLPPLSDTTKGRAWPSRGAELTAWGPAPPPPPPLLAEVLGVGVSDGLGEKGAPLYTPTQGHQKRVLSEEHTGRHSQPLFQDFLSGPLWSHSAPGLGHPEATEAVCDIHSANTSAPSLPASSCPVAWHMEGLPCCVLPGPAVPLCPFSVHPVDQDRPAT